MDIAARPADARAGRGDLVARKRQPPSGRSWRRWRASSRAAMPATRHASSATIFNRIPAAIAGRQQADRVFGQESGRRVRNAAARRGVHVGHRRGSPSSRRAGAGAGFNEPVEHRGGHERTAAGDFLISRQPAGKSGHDSTILRTSRPPRGKGGGRSVQIAESGDPRRLPRLEGRDDKQIRSPPPPPPCRQRRSSLQLNPPAQWHRRESPPDVPRFRSV